MEIQDDINSTMRAILIDWLVEVHMKFRLVPQTLYLCVNIIDRYLAQVQVERKKLQLVGVTALLVACKYEEIYPPEVRDCVYITDRTYTRQEVLDMEQSIVRVLEFKLTAPHGHNFLTRFLKITKAPELVSTAANYYMERTLQEYVFLNYRPSLVAAAAVCLAWNNSDVIENTGDNSINPPGVVRTFEVTLLSHFTLFGLVTNKFRFFPSAASNPSRLHRLPRICHQEMRSAYC
jgi:hypothetical protein